jgi:hypothetical protein
MVLETDEKEKIEFDSENQREPEEIRKERKISRTIVCIIILIILLMLLICYRIATIGFNSVEAWQVDKIELTEENLQIENDTKINIFSKTDDKSTIAPRSKGTYRFSVKNDSNYDMIYNIKFEDDMTNYINMKYRLKIDNIYIRGNSDKYISIDELNVDSVVVPKNSINVYGILPGKVHASVK